ncbi:MAG: hypothetical protein NC433_04690 [Clostridiales bacterium]|nr:hypothetical protein [Clostridiales bacterium]
MNLIKKKKTRSKGKRTRKITAYLLDISLIYAFIVYVGLLWHFMVDVAYSFMLFTLIENEQALASFLLLFNVIATGKYCDAKDDTKQKLYLIIALVGYFLLFINENVISIVLMGIGFMLFLLVYEPQKEYVKRIMQMAFVYFFMLSNMSLIINYTTLILVECRYSLENGVYLDLIIASAGVLFFSFWDRLSQDEDRLLHEFRNAVKWILAGTGIILFLLLTMGNRLESIDGGKGIAVLTQFSAELRGYATGHNGTFYDVMARFGMAGGAVLICIVVAAIKKMQKQICGKRVNSLFVVLFIMYLIQSLFFSIQFVTAPIYIVLLAIALCGNSRNYISNIDNGRKEKMER